MDSEIMFPDLCPYSRRMGMDPVKRSEVPLAPTGPTMEIDDPDHRSSFLDTVGNMALDRTRSDMRTRFMTVESQQAAALRNQAMYERDQLHAALIQDHSWFHRNWQRNKVFCAVLLMIPLFLGIFTYTGSFLALWLAALCYGACAGWAVFVFMFRRRPPIGDISHVGPPGNVIES